MFFIFFPLCLKFLNINLRFYSLAKKLISMNYNLILVYKYEKVWRLRKLNPPVLSKREKRMSA